MLKRISKFKKLSGREKFLFIEALALHLWAGLVLKVVPFKWIPGLFSSRQSAVSSRQSTVVELIKIAIGRASMVSPWRNRCLVSSLAGRCMLRRRKISSQLSLGVAKGPMGKTIAHAWLKAGNVEIIERKGDYTELFSF